MMDRDTFREFSCSLMILKRQDCDLRQLFETALHSQRTLRDEVSMLGLRSVYLAKQMQGRKPYSSSYQAAPKESATLKVFMILNRTSPSAFVVQSGLTQNPQSYFASILSCLYLKLTVKKKAVRSLSLLSFLILLNCALALLSEVKPFMKTEKQKQHSSPFILPISSFSYLFSQAMMQMGLCFLLRRLSWQFFLMPLKILERGKMRWPMSLGSSEPNKIWLRFSMMNFEENTCLTTSRDFLRSFPQRSYAVLKVVNFACSQTVGCVFLASSQKIFSKSASLALYLLMQKVAMRKNLTSFLGSLTPPAPRIKELLLSLTPGMKVPSNSPPDRLMMLFTSLEINSPDLVRSLANLICCLLLEVVWSGRSPLPLEPSLQHAFPIIIYQLSTLKMNKSTHAETVYLRCQDRAHVLHQLVLAAVGWQFQPIEAGVALGIRVVLVDFYLLDGELVDLVPVALQERKAQDRHSARSCYKVQQISKFFLIESLHVPPEPSYLLIAGLITHIYRRSPPILDIDVLWAVEQHLHLMRLEHRHQLKWNHTIDCILDLLHIPLAALDAQVIHQEIDVFPLVGVSYEDSGAVGLQLDLLLLALLAHEVGEVELEFLCIGVVENVLPVVVHLPVIAVKITELNLMAADLSPNAACEEAVQGNAVEESLADHYAQQSAYLHSILIFSFFFDTLNDEAIGRFISVTQPKQP